MDYGAIVRTCMIKSFERAMMPARKIMDLEKTDLAMQSGASEETISDIEAGKLHLTHIAFIALAAVFDNMISHNNAPVYEYVRKILEVNYDDPDLPEKHAEQFRKLEDKPFLQRWFMTFGDIFNQLDKEADELFDDEDFSLIANNYKIFIDETVLDCEDFSEFMVNLQPYLEEADQRTGKNIPVRITKDVLAAIHERGSNIIDEDDEMAFKNAYENLTAYQNSGLLEVFNANSVNEVFNSEANKNKYRFIMITQDGDFARGLMTSSNAENRKAPVLTAYVCKGGNLALYGYENEEDERLNLAVLAGGLEE